MKKIFAVPTLGGKLSPHFGRAEKFAIIETENNEIISEKLVEPPAHEPGAYPRFLSELGVSVIIAGGMGKRAIDLFEHFNIEYFMRASSDEPAELVKDYLNDSLETGDNLCDSDERHSHNHHNGNFHIHNN